MAYLPQKRVDGLGSMALQFDIGHLALHTLRAPCGHAHLQHLQHEKKAVNGTVLYVNVGGRLPAAVAGSHSARIASVPNQAQPTIRIRASQQNLSHDNHYHNNSSSSSDNSNKNPSLSPRTTTCYRVRMLMTWCKRACRCHRNSSPWCGGGGGGCGASCSSCCCCEGCGW